MDTLNLLFPLMIFAVFWLFIIRPQNKIRKEQENFIDNLQKGMEIVTTSGIHGKINKIDGNTITLQVDTKTFIKVVRSAISKEMTEQSQSTNEKVQQG